MKKLYTIIVLCLLSISILHAQKRIEIDNQTPGWLSSLLTYSQQQEVEEIKVSGYINQLDIYFLRDMTDLSLKSIDLYNANIVKYNDYPANTLIKKFFDRNYPPYDKPLINKFILPKTIETVNNDAFDFSYIDTLVVGHKNINTPLPSTNFVKNIILMEGIETITASMKSSYIISKIPESVVTMEGTSINIDRLKYGLNIPANIEYFKNVLDSYSYETLTGKGLRTALNESKINIPSKCKEFDLRNYIIYADTLIIPPSVEKISARFGVKHMVCLSPTPPTIDYNFGYPNIYKLDTIFCPHGCGDLYRKEITYSTPIIEMPLLVESISFDQESYQVYTSDKIRLTPSYSPTEAENNKFTWSSSDENIATVDSNGNVTGVKAGITTITAMSTTGVSGSCEVQVLQHVQGISLPQKEFKIEKLGETILLQPQITPFDASDKTITWESSSPNVCHVTNGGIVTALDYGMAIITATTIDGGFKDYCKITVEKGAISVTDIIITPESIIMQSGETTKLSATILPNDADNKGLIWSSSNSSIVTVDNNGIITAIKEGNAIITAQAIDGSGVTATCNITVNKQIVNISSLSFHESSVTLKPGDTHLLSVEILPHNASNQKLIWSSTNRNVLTVDDSGLVSAISLGKSMVIAATTDGSNISAICEITVDNENGIYETPGNEKLEISTLNTSIIVNGNISDKTISIYSMDGRLITRTTPSDNSIEIQLPSRSIYIVKILNRTFKVKI